MNELSDRKLKILSALAILVIGWLCWNGSSLSHAQSAPANQSPQMQEVVKLTQAKMSDDVILAYIKNSGASYNLSADDILYLNNQGVSQPVISALLQSKSSAAPAPAPLAAPSTQAPAVSPAQVSPYPGQQVSQYPGPAVAATPAVAPPSEPPAGSEVTLPYFQTQLAPYGTWVDVPGVGSAWAPFVARSAPDWRPYLNDGHWEYVDDGWFWRSDYPWGEYAFHYGRWMRDPRFGWVWVPGYHWGPAWVCWRDAAAEGYCGWAPLPPGARFEPGVGLMWDGRLALDVDFGLAPEMFVFVPFDHFWAHDYLAFRAPFGRVPFLFRASVVANHYNVVGGRIVFGGIGRERVAALTHHEVHVERVEFHDAHVAHSRDIERAHGGGLDHGRPAQGHDDGRSGRDHDFNH